MSRKTTIKAQAAPIDDVDGTLPELKPSQRVNWTPGDFPIATFESAASQSNILYWEVHSLLSAALSLLSDFDDDAIEVRTVIQIVRAKALEMQMVLNPFVPGTPVKVMG